MPASLLTAHFTPYYVIVVASRGGKTYAYLFIYRHKTMHSPTFSFLILIFKLNVKVVNLNVEED